MGCNYLSPSWIPDFGTPLLIYKSTLGNIWWDFDISRPFCVSSETGKYYTVQYAIVCYFAPWYIETKSSNAMASFAWKKYLCNRFRDIANMDGSKWNGPPGMTSAKIGFGFKIIASDLFEDKRWLIIYSSITGIRCPCGHQWSSDCISIFTSK